MEAWTRRMQFVKNAVIFYKVSIKYISRTTNLATHVKRRRGVDTAVAAPAPLPSRSDNFTKANDGGRKTAEKSIIKYFGSDALAGNSNRSQAITNGIAYFIRKDVQPYAVFTCGITGGIYGQVVTAFSDESNKWSLIPLSQQNWPQRQL